MSQIDKLNEYKLHIGSYSWLHDSWNDSFYPEDLPVEWQFAYYANEYSVIMVPWAVLHDNFELLEQGIDDSEASCRLIFEMPIDDISNRSSEVIISEVQRFLEKVSFVGDRGLGIVYVLQYSDICHISNSKIELLTSILETSHTQLNTCIDLKQIETLNDSIKPLPEKLSSLLSTTKTGLCRHNDISHKLAVNWDSKLQVTLCDIAKCDPKKMRKIVENSLVDECADTTNVLIFQSESPSHEQMNTASVISDLL